MTTLAHDRAGWLSALKIKPRKVNAKNETAYPSTIVFSIETPNDPLLLELLGKIQANGEPIVFGVAPAQPELDESPNVIVGARALELHSQGGEDG